MNISSSIFFFIAYSIIPILIILSIDKRNENKDIFLDKRTSLSIKGICSIIVVIVHLAQRIEGPSFLSMPFTIIGKYAVGIFFFLSAYGLMTSYLKNEYYLNNFFKKRIISIYIPFVLINLIDVFAGIYRGTELTLIQSILYISGLFLFDTTLWFIQAILFFYTSFYISVKLFKGLNKSILVMFMFTYIYIFIGIILDIKIWGTSSALAFLMGFIFSIKKDTIINIIKKYYLSSIYMCIVTISVTLILSPDKLIIQSVVDNISICITLLLIITILLKFKLNCEITEFIGNISYEIYLLHMKIMLLVGINFELSFSILKLLMYTLLLLITSYLFNNINSFFNNKFKTNRYLAK